ncbi:uncharacterized protein BO87DRAFT_128187 [Aspergillus neoniger CBS 115656]|uniref:Uncharacterized protein n=1 Tax=Aspergillus neoniger (strain CBS 115656) TaxID=1448310 RepID=A0A318Z490_ASPNB|nr:hypothetical protein BO87DRAFT_128187 [Aspergillus neoniger CBS 115656]PYH38520.1 hypothetical protein BO87DRAFT_128187 [Aspergillus neoniger CBS 115656]
MARWFRFFHLSTTSSSPLRRPRTSADYLDYLPLIPSWVNAIHTLVTLVQSTPPPPSHPCSHNASQMRYTPPPPHQRPSTDTPILSLGVHLTSQLQHLVSHGSRQLDQVNLVMLQFLVEPSRLARPMRGPRHPDDREAAYNMKRTSPAAISGLGSPEMK